MTIQFWIYKIHINFKNICVHIVSSSLLTGFEIGLGPGNNHLPSPKEWL